MTTIGVRTTDYGLRNHLIKDSKVEIGAFRDASSASRALKVEEYMYNANVASPVRIPISNVDNSIEILTQ